MNWQTNKRAPRVGRREPTVLAFWDTATGRAVEPNPLLNDYLPPTAQPMPPMQENVLPNYQTSRTGVVDLVG
jgi:hypothetical protein